jgi:hypothetical protein
MIIVTRYVTLTTVFLVIRVLTACYRDNYQLLIVITNHLVLP